MKKYFLFLFIIPVLFLGFFNLAAACSISAVTPTAPTAFTPGGTLATTWQKDCAGVFWDNAANYSLSLVPDTGFALPAIQGTVDSYLSGHIVVPIDTPTGKYRISVVASTVQGLSSTVVVSRDKVTAPSVTSIWPAGSTQAIKWTVANPYHPLIPAGTPVVIDLISMPAFDTSRPVQSWQTTFSGDIETSKTVTLAAAPIVSAGFYKLYIHKSDNSYILISDQFQITAPAPTTYTLTVTATNGTVTKNPSGPYRANAPVELTATPNTGFRFVAWNGPGVPRNTTDNPYNYTMPPGDVTISAGFLPVTGGNPIDKFTNGDRIETNDTVNVRDSAGISDTTVLETKLLNTHGRVIEGPIVADGNTWWLINYDCGEDGWTAESFLDKDTSDITDDCGTGNPPDGGSNPTGWQDPPPGEPPRNCDLPENANVIGCNPPINVSSVFQIKSGDLSVGGLFVDNGAAIGGILKLPLIASGGQFLTTDSAGRVILDNPSINTGDGSPPPDLVCGSTDKLLWDGPSSTWSCVPDLQGINTGGGSPPPDLVCGSTDKLLWDGPSSTWSCVPDLQSTNPNSLPSCVDSTKPYIKWNGELWACDAGVGDNLGNHTASQNIKLSGKWLSSDGGNEGVYVDNSGNVALSSTIKITGGSPDVGKVLTATNTGGNATWQMPAGGGPGSSLVCTDGSKKLNWDGTSWSCANITTTSTSGVTSITPGNNGNISINSTGTGGTGDVTISAMVADSTFKRYRCVDTNFWAGTYCELPPAKSCVISGVHRGFCNIFPTTDRARTSGTDQQKINDALSKAIPYGTSTRNGIIGGESFSGEKWWYVQNNNSDCLISCEL